MANVKFSALPTASSVASTDIICITQGGVSKSATASLLVDDTAYASSWNGVTTVAGSKNAIYDQLHKIDTADDGSIISASTGFRIAGAAASGKILIGNGTNFVASTPTFPNTAGTAGKVLISDGTNFVTSTPTYPNASAAIGKFMRSDGTNFVVSGSTYPDSSPVGRIMYSDGTNWVASGPTWPNGNPASGKVLIGDGTNFIISTPTYPNTSATAGKVLVSDGTNFIASTPTYPNAASPTARKQIVSDGTNWVASTETWAVPGTAGKILISDGTNWITSTPTFPNASATARKFMVSDGTNWVASTETQATPGASGNTLVSDGTNWVSEILILSNAKTSQQTLSNSDAYLAGSTITVPAGGWIAGMVYYCVFQMFKSAGTGTIVITVRVGTLGTTGDAVLLATTMPGAGTAVNDTGRFEIIGIIRTIGASATSAVLVNVSKGLTTTGLINTSGQFVVGAGATGTAFNTNTATKIGVSFNGSTNFAGTCDFLMAELRSP